MSFWIERGERARVWVAKTTHLLTLSLPSLPPQTYSRSDRKNMETAPPLSEAYLASGGVEREKRE